MYEEFYHLQSRPFQLNPDPRFFFRSVGHKRAEAYMRYGLQQGQGFIIVTGDVGTGKTMLVNNLFREIDGNRLVAAKIVSTNVSEVDLLRLIAAEFDMPFERSSKASLLNRLESFFKDCHRNGQRVLLVIDETQNLSRSALEELRMLMNFEFQGTPLVQSFLLGQREFRGMLRAPGLEQMRQRVIAAYHLKPLTEPEVKSYVEHRLRTSGWKDDPRIEAGVFPLLYKETNGVPRRINTLFDRVLLSGHLDELHDITVQTFRNAVEEVREEQGDPESSEPETADQGKSRPGRTADSGEKAQDSAQSEIAALKRHIDRLESTVDALRRQSDSQAPGDPNSNTLISGPRFPAWTIAFVSIVVVIAMAAVAGFAVFV